MASGGMPVGDRRADAGGVVGSDDGDVECDDGHAAVAGGEDDGPRVERVENLARGAVVAHAAAGEVCAEWRGDVCGSDADTDLPR